jgi:hypothetical protein
MPLPIADWRVPIGGSTIADCRFVGLSIGDWGLAIVD